MSTQWWLVVVCLAASLAFVAGFICCNELRLWNRARERGGFIEPRTRVGVTSNERSI